MSDQTRQSPSHRELTSSPSIFAYQTRLLDSPTHSASFHTLEHQPQSQAQPHSPLSTISTRGNSYSLASLATSSSHPGSPDTIPSPESSGPSVRLGRMGSISRFSLNDSGQSELRRSGSGARIGLGIGGGSGVHGRGKSVDLVRGQWEAKINEAASLGSLGNGSGSPPPATKGSPNPSTPRTTRAGLFSPPTSSSSTMTSTPAVSTPLSSVTSTPTTKAYSVQRKRATVIGLQGWDPSTIPSSTFSTNTAPTTSINLTSEPASFAHSSGVPTIDNESTTDMPLATRSRPPSISSATALLSPTSTGGSGSRGTRSVEDTLAEARANALRRLEAKKKAQGGQAPSTTSTDATNNVTPPLTSMKAPDTNSPATFAKPNLPESSIPTSTKVSSLTGLFTPPAATLSSAPLSKPSESPRSVPTPDLASTPTFTPLTPRSSAGSSVSALATRFAPPPSASVICPSPAPVPVPTTTASVAGIGGKDKYGSISRSDRRRLGRHLPRIASGDQGWDEDEDQISGRVGHSRAPSGVRDRKSSLGRSSDLAASTLSSEEENTPPLPKPKTTALSMPTEEPVPSITSSPWTKNEKRTAVEVLAPSQMANKPSETPPLTDTNGNSTFSTLSGGAMGATPVTPSSKTEREAKRRSTYMPFTPKSTLTTPIGVASPRPEVVGNDMKGLMSAIGSMPTRPPNDEDGDGVAGMSNRIRLSRLPLPAASVAMAPAPLPSRRLAGQNNNWMDKQRHALAAYEYLCHVGEAQQWIEGCLDEELNFGVTELEEGLRDGVVLAKLARVYEGEHVVKRIWTEAKHRFRQSDNINYFLNFVRNMGMPDTFIFELTDLYDKKNMPKVIFCIHVLSHLLARLGRAERIGNLVGQFEFTDEQLAATQKGLQGVAMPNFGQVGQTLAKEASWEPLEEVETEDEVRDRLLLECEGSIIDLQRYLRGRLSRMRASRVHAQLELAEPIVVRLQSQARGRLARQSLAVERNEKTRLGTWAIKLQAAARAHIASTTWEKRIRRIQRGTERIVVPLQAQARGMLTRVKVSEQQNALDKATRSVVAIQSACRTCLAKRKIKGAREAMRTKEMVASITAVQATLRRHLAQRAASNDRSRICAQERTFTSLQRHLRGALVRRTRRAHEEKMDDATDYIVGIQSIARGVLARRRKAKFTTVATEISPSVISLQAFARARLARRNHQSMQKALAKVEVAGSVGGLQAFLRTKLAKKQTIEQKKKLEFVQPDVIGFQAIARGHLARREFREWRDYLIDPHTQGALVFLQSIIRGFLARRNLYLRMLHYHRHTREIIKIQSVWRGRTQRLMYDKLITGIGVDVATIQNYMHLLDDTETDFGDQLRIDTLRKQVVELLRTNQTLETEVGELDTKIALILKNKLTFEELVRAKRRHVFSAGDNLGDGTLGHVGGGANNDPFAGVHLDRTSQRKLELYEHLFFTLQTEPKYLSRLLRSLANASIAKGESADNDRRLVEGVSLILFGFGHERREEYLFHKLLQFSIHEEVLRSKSLVNIRDSRMAITSVTTQFVKPALTPYLQTVLSEHVSRIVAAPELDLCTDPVEIYNRVINAQEMSTGVPSGLPRDLDADQVLQASAESRTLYIQHLQELRALTNFLITTLTKTTHLVPYTIRLLARECLFALRVRYQDALDSELWPVVAKTVVLPFILPALIAPETYGIISNTIDPLQRRNLDSIANLLNHVATQETGNLDVDRLVRVPLSEYIRAEGRVLGDWILDLAEVDFQVQELLESTSEATPINITRNDIYGMLSVLLRNSEALTGSTGSSGNSGSGKRANDTIMRVLEELEGPPIEYDRSQTAVRLRLTNRLAELQPSDPQQAHIREMEVQAKRHVLAVLRIQSGSSLYDVLLAHPTDHDENRWIEEVHRDIAMEMARRARHNLPPTPVEQEYQMESIRSLPFHEVKSRAIEFCMRLVALGRLSRDDKLQGLLVSIASDIKEKHRLRQKRKTDLSAMTEAFQHQSEKKVKFEEQIQSYHDYIDSAMAALQQRKKTPFMSKQFWHQRGAGKRSKFGSYKYTAADLYEKGILLSVNQFSPRQFDRLHIVISSDEIGVFTLEMSSSGSLGEIPTGSPALGGGSSGLIGREEIRMEDLLQAQFDNNVRLDLFDGMAAFNLNTLIHQINKKFYAS